MHMSSESLLIVLVVGLIAGWLAGQIVQGSGFGWLATGVALVVSIPTFVLSRVPARGLSSELCDPATPPSAICLRRLRTSDANQCKGELLFERWLLVAVTLARCPRC